MARAAEYWSYARECEHWATDVYDEQDRKVFLELAEAWTKLALKEQGAFRTKRSPSNHHGLTGPD